MGVPQQPTAFLLTFWGGVENGFGAFDMNPMVYARKYNVRFYCNGAKKKTPQAKQKPVKY